MTAAHRPWRLPAIAFWATALLVLLPPMAVMAYAFSERWDQGLLPQGATLQWLAGLAADAQVRSAAWNTVWISGAAAALAVLLGGAASLVGHLAAPRLKALLDALALLPYAIPPVVVAIGALDLFVGRWGDVLDLRAVYVGLLAALLFPLVHQTLSAALQQLDARPLVEASRTLGASDALLLRRVLLPLLLPAIAAAGLLAWMTAAMEFAIANLLLGGTLELLQPLINGLRGANGHLAAALVVVSFALVTGLGVLVHLLTSWRTPARS
ncbi:ABC transporter permease [Roseateles cellulosilyticus]|uniref:ABC transporter permease subunit n=1 Tax=Pelomonas cellulosilytica TaxID=2906762 RepID=A0ABS8XM14_9BURK|nr:ABC transporter permease subunit [Pelomonas sp. P8]MCE4553824.1 ABC transporter permease subunit [Pelomonas sp. P8]